MSNWDVPLCRYLHLPLQVLWYSVEEWFLLGGIYFAGLMADAIIWLLIPAVLYAGIPALRKKHRSYFKHTQLLLGIKELKGYPPPTSGRFCE